MHMIIQVAAVGLDLVEAALAELAPRLDAFAAERGDAGVPSICYICIILPYIILYSVIS